MEEKDLKNENLNQETQTQQEDQPKKGWSLTKKIAVGVGSAAVVGTLGFFGYKWYKKNKENTTVLLEEDVVIPVESPKRDEGHRWREDRKDNRKDYQRVYPTDQRNNSGNKDMRENNKNFNNINK